MVSASEICVKKDHPILGNIKEYAANPLAFLQKNQAIYGDQFSFYFAHRKLTFINDPELIGQLLQKNHKNYRKNLAYRKLRLLLGDGLFTSEGNKWLTQRRIIQPAFSRNHIQNYYSTINECISQTLDKWQHKEKIELTEEMTALTLRIICRTMLGIDIKEEKGKIIEQHLPYTLNFMIKRITSAINLPVWIPTAKNRAFNHSVNQMKTLLKELIQYKKAHPGNDLISELIKDGQMDDDTLYDEMMTIFLAGHETTAVALTWGLYLIGTHSEVKRKITAEISQQKLSAGAYKDLPYLHNVIKEILRLKTPVWIMGREAIDNDTLQLQYLKKGDSVIFSPYLLHRHPSYWNDPETFNPDRFEIEPQRFTYIPFGDGPRLCAGMHFALLEMMVILYRILEKYPDFEIENTKEPSQSYSLTLRPSEGIFFNKKSR